jgi:geranylgeranyl reductase family protein
MSQQKHYDVIIIGAGPAGATLAFELANAGINVLIIEKCILPRYKCCGGGITFKTSKLLDTLGISPPDSVFENTITTADIIYGNEHHDFQTPDEILMFTVSRDRFDYSLVMAAKKAGVDIIQSSATALKLNVNDISVIVDNHTFYARYLAGADGANGITAKMLGLCIDNRIIGIESEVGVSSQMMKDWEHRILLELGRVRDGYAWVFPKYGHLSVGIGCNQRYAMQLRKHYDDFLRSLEINPSSVINIRGGIIPMCTPDTLFNNGRTLLLGDAAGLADPLTGEGIYNAIFSAHLAAISLKKAIDNNSSDLNEYTKLVKEQIIPEIRTAGTFSKILTLVPQRLFNMLQQDERVWRGCRYLLRGDINYTDIMNKVKTLGGMYNFVFHR